MTPKKDADDFDVLIDPPGPFCSAHVLREFLQGLDRMPDCQTVREVRAEYQKYLAHAEAREAAGGKG
jgi:hypothetical protein